MQRQLSGQLLEDYLKDPNGNDLRVRQACGVPSKFYYTVSVWPTPGLLTVDEKRLRTVPVHKISKSDQNSDPADWWKG